ncbi:MAG: YraN family protein [Planctomycetes bacterium GWF2_41_51]|nr:MAG: YraN family protein [Planctomycetes bacterium GWF2_41_51]
MSDAHLLGQWGQKQCEKFYKVKGFKTLTRNFACRTGEIDLIMGKSDGTIVFVEVKTRKSEKFAQAESAISYSKKLRMTKAARLFVNKYKLENNPLRFDVVIVIPNEKGKAEIRHYENAFVPL